MTLYGNSRGCTIVVTPWEAAPPRHPQPGEPGERPPRDLIARFRGARGMGTRCWLKTTLERKTPFWGRPRFVPVGPRGGH